MQLQIAFCIMVLVNVVMGKYTHDEFLYNDAHPIGPKGLRLPPGTDGMKGTLAANDKVDCYQYYSDKRANGYVRFLQKPATTTLQLAGRVTARNSTESTCKNSDPSTSKVIIFSDCQAVTFNRGTSYICVRYSGASQSKQAYEVAISPPSGPLVILNEPSALGGDATDYAEIPTGVNTIVGTIGGYTGTGGNRKQDTKDCFLYALGFNPPQSAIIFKKQPPGVTLKFYVLDQSNPTQLNSTENVGHCSEADYFQTPTNITNNMHCFSVQFSVMNQICVELQPFTRTKQWYELYLSLPGTYFDFTPY